jgi:hypothetical protein
MILYKLTDEDGYTRRGKENETRWAEDTTHTAIGTGGLCTDGVIHAYEHPLIASFMNPIHASIQNPLLWECEGEIIARDGQMLCGCKTLTLLNPMPMPEITTAQRVRISIKCALLVYHDPGFVSWANGWLNGSDHTDAARWRSRGLGAAAALAAAKAAAWSLPAWSTLAAECAAAWAALAAVEAAKTKNEEEFDLPSIIQSAIDEENLLGN